MKKVIIALDNICEYEKIKSEIHGIDVISKDIIYREGILEKIEDYNNVNYVILDDGILGEINMKNLLKKIKEKNRKIKIILISEKQEYSEFVDYLIEKFSIKKINKIINKKSERKENLLEIEKYVDKNIKHFENRPSNVKDNTFKILNKDKNYTEENKKQEIALSRYRENKIDVQKFKEKEIITILGTGGVGKSIFTLNLVNILKKEKCKILILDFDILNNSLHTILGVKKYSNKIKKRVMKNNLLEKFNIKELIIRINKNIDLVSGVNILFDRNYKISPKKIKNIIEELKNNYDYIIIDTSNECFFEYTKELIKNSTKSVFLIEPNLTEIKKAKRLLDLYEQKWKIDINKINIVYNKICDMTIQEGVLNNIFSKFNIAGEIKYNKYYNLLINCNMKIRKMEIERDFKKIKNNLFGRVLDYGVRKKFVK